MPSWLIGVIVAVSVTGVVFGLLYLLSRATDLRYEARAKHKIPIMAVLGNYHIPDPPKQYCEHCGAELTWRLLGAMEHYYGKFNQATGEEQFIVFARFSCPKDKKHNPIWDGVYWLNTGSDGWAWYEPFELKPMREPRVIVERSNSGNEQEG